MMKNFFLLLCTLSLSNLVYSQWTTQKLSVKRYDLCSCKTDEKLFFIGGVDKANKPTKTIDILNLNSGEWSSKELLHPKSRPKCFVIDEKIYVTGGSQTTVDSKAVEVLDLDGNTIKVENTPKATGGLALEKDGKIYITAYSELDIFDTKNNTWKSLKTPLSREVFLPRDNFGYEIIGDKLILAGGTYFGTEYDQVSIFDIKNETWDSDTLSVKRKGVLSLSNVNETFFIGGSDGSFSYFKSMEINNSSNKTWRLDSLSKGERFDMAGHVYQDKMYVAGGQVISFGDQFINLIDIYDFKTKLWSKNNLPTGRSSMTIIGAGNKVFFAGGRSDEEDETDVVDILQLSTSSVGNVYQFNKGIVIYPNPASQQLFINYPDESHQFNHFEIYNSGGKLILFGDIIENQININVCKNGLYFLKLINNLRNSTEYKSFNVIK